MKFKSIKYADTTLKEIVFRMKDVEEVPAGFTRNHTIKSPADLFGKYRFLFEGLDTEKFVVFILDSANHVVAIKTVSEGILNSSLVHPREVFRSAIVLNAASIILAHNHPSGNPEPSAEDLMITKQLVEGGKIISIPIHDHIIFAGQSFTSFAERGLI
mgnify:FL=1